MDEIWQAASALWWVFPTAAAVVAVGILTRRGRGTMNERRLGLDAARWDLQVAQHEARSAAVALRIARAETAKAVAERAATRGESDAVAAARRRLREAQLASKSTSAGVRAARARITAERAAIGSAQELPLARERARHEGVLARWMRYETDPALVLAYPQMSDGRHPQTAAFLAILVQARDLRPAENAARVTAAEFSAYRGAVDALERSFESTERWARGERDPQELPDALRSAARNLADTSTEMLGRTADVLQSLADRLNRKQ